MDTKQKAMMWGLAALGLGGILYLLTRTSNSVATSAAAGAWALAEPRIGFLLVPQFSMMAFSAAVEPLRVANRLAGRELYRWEIVSRDGGSVASSPTSM